MNTKKIKAENVRLGDFLPGLDNGYVVEVDEEHGLVSGRYNTAFASECQIITFHTAEGDEAHIICPPDMPVTVQRDGEFDEEDE